MSQRLRKGSIVTDGPFDIVRSPVVAIVQGGAGGPGPTVGPFQGFDINRAASEIGRVSDKFSDQCLKFYSGDHWQAGEQWVGPTPTDTSIRTTVMQDIEKQFVAENVIAEVIDRHVDAIMARLISSWQLVSKKQDVCDFVDPQTQPPSPPTRGQLPQPPKLGNTPPSPGDVSANSDNPALTVGQNIDDKDPTRELRIKATKWMREWFKRREIQKIIREALVNLLISKRGSVRLFIPSANIVNGSIPKFQMPGESTDSSEVQQNVFDIIFAEPLAFDNSFVAIDNTTMDRASLVVVNRWNQARRMNYRHFELCWVDPKTQLTTIYTDSMDPDVDWSQVTLNLGGKMIMHEMTREKFIKLPIISQQKLLNMSLTMMARNVVLAGFLERTISGAQVPGEWVDNANVVGGKEFRPKGLDVGAGKTTFLSPFVVTDEEGRNSLGNPSITYRDPVPVDTFKSTKDICYHTILNDTGQVFALFAKDGVSAPEARVHARAAFANTLLKTKPEADSLMEWIVETVLQMAATFSGQPDMFKNIKTVCDARPDTGPLSPEEKKIVIEQYKSGLLSRSATMVLLGVEDVDMETINIEKQKRITTPLELAAILTALSRTGWQLSLDQMPEVDWQVLGINPRDVGKYKTELEWQAALQAPTGGNSGASGGPPTGSSHKPASKPPGPGSGAHPSNPPTGP